MQRRLVVENETELSGKEFNAFLCDFSLFVANE